MSTREEDQRERAEQTWELVILDAIAGTELATARKILRLKRFEVPGLLASIPGSVRRGARVDLAPLEAELSLAGIRCKLQHRAREHGEAAPVPGREVE